MSHTKLISLLVLLITVISGATFAGGDYTVYGKLHLSVDMMNDTEDSQVRLSSNTSRFGIKGAGEMNDELSLIWQFENAINLARKDDEDFTFTGLANRNTYIGFKHEYGTMLFGIHDTPFRTLGRQSTFFFDSLGDHRTVTMGMDQRLEEIVMFTTKDYEGFQMVAMYQFDQNEYYDSEMASTFDLSAMYKKDNFFVGGAMDMATKGNYGMDGDWDNDPATEDTWAVGTVDTNVYNLDYEPESPMALRFGFGYNADEFGVRGLFQTISNKGGVKDLSAMTFGGEAKYSLNADYALKGSYYMADPNTDLDDDEYGLLALGLDRNFGKSQSVYLQYAMVMNGNASEAPLGDTSWHGNSISPYAAGEAPFGISFGMVKKW